MACVASARLTSTGAALMGEVTAPGGGGCAPTTPSASAATPACTMVSSFMRA